MPNICKTYSFSHIEIDCNFFVVQKIPTRQAKEYCLFGAPMPGRNFQSSTPYRYGMNGQENDDEITGNHGTHTSAMYWEYDSRLGRRWNLDPKPQISISDYACFANNPIWFSDVNGDEVDYGKKGEGRVRNKINSFFSRVFSKSYRESYRSWRDAKTEDGTSIVYHLQKTTDKPSLISGGEVTMNSDIDKTVKYGGFGSLEFESKTIGSDRHSPELLKGHEAFKKDKRETVTEEFNLKRRVPGFDITLNAATIPDEFTVTNQTTGTEILPPTVLGGSNYSAVLPPNGKSLVLNNVSAGDIKVIVESNRVNPCTDCTPNATNTDYTIKYEKYRGMRIKIPVPKIK